MGEMNLIHYRADNNGLFSFQIILLLSTFNTTNPDFYVTLLELRRNKWSLFNSLFNIIPRKEIIKLITIKGFCGGCQKFTSNKSSLIQSWALEGGVLAPPWILKFSAKKVAFYFW